MGRTAIYVYAIVIALACVSVGCVQVEPTQPPQQQPVEASALSGERIVELVRAASDQEEPLGAREALETLMLNLDSPGVRTLLELQAQDGDMAQHDAAETVAYSLFHGWATTGEEFRGRRSALRRCVVAQATHADAAVRLVVLQWLTFFAKDKTLLPAMSAAIRENVTHDSPDVRFMALRAATLFSGPDIRGCVVFGPRASDYDIDELEPLLLAAFSDDMDPRVRAAALGALAWTTVSRHTEAISTYFTSVDRRPELHLLAAPLVSCCLALADHSVAGELEQGSRREAAGFQQAIKILRPLIAQGGAARRNAVMALLLVHESLGSDPVPLWLLRRTELLLRVDGDDRGLISRRDAAFFARTLRVMEELLSPDHHRERWAMAMADELGERIAEREREGD